MTIRRLPWFALTVGLLTARIAVAAGPPPLDARSPLEWWAAPGGPGQVDDVHMGIGLPFTWMGHIAGGVALRDGLLPAFSPWPGIVEIAAPRAWYDSVEVVVGEDAGWRGYSASLVELRATAEPERSRRPRAAFTLVNGTSAMDRTGLYLQRGGDDSWLRGGALTEERSGTGRLDRRGQHVWFADLGLRRGAHTFAGTFSQRGQANGTRLNTARIPEEFPPPYAGLEDAARGEAGSLRWGWERGARRLKTTLARSHDHRESFESLFLLSFAEREAQQNTLEIEATTGDDARNQGLRLELTRSQVETSVDQLTVFRDPVDARQATTWLAARDRRSLLGGRLDLQLGAGYVDSPERRGERWQVAPSLVWTLGEAGRRWRVHMGRFVVPVWSDLAPGVRPFVQDTWAAGGGLALGSERQWAEVSGMVTETGNRALLKRWPIQHIALRLGWTPDLVRVQDALVQGAAGARRGPFGVDASMWSRVRPLGSETARVDPAVGGRAGADARFAVFAGDLGVRLRFETAWVGDRETEFVVNYFTPPQPLPGYFTSSAIASITIGDASLVFRANNLEDVPHPQVWVDPTTPIPGTPAVGSGRQLRFELSWPLFN